MKLYCDMDGCLVNFEDGVLKHMNKMLMPIAMDKSNPLNEVVHAALAEMGGHREITLADIDRAPDESSLPHNKKVREYMKSLVGDDKDLWAGLSWERQGKELWDYISEIPGLEILSAPMEQGSKVGKYIWCKRELNMPSKRVNLSDSKKSFGTHKGEPAVLIDDRDKYVDEFREGGGIAIKHNPDNVDSTIRQLKELGF